MSFNIINLTGDTRVALQSLRDMPRQLGDLLERLQYENIQVNLDQNLSVGGKTKKINQITAQYMSEVDKLEERAKLFKADLERWINERLSKPTGEPSEELLNEIRLDKAWRRLVKIFDSVQERGALIRTLNEVISDAIKNDDKIVLDALDEELPFYFQARNLSISPTLTEQIRAARIAHSNPAERQALALREELGTGFPRLTLIFGEVRRAIQSRATVAVLPGWDSTEQISLNLPAEPAGMGW